MVRPKTGNADIWSHGHVTMPGPDQTRVWSIPRDNIVGDKSSRMWCGTYMILRMFLFYNYHFKHYSTFQIYTKDTIYIGLTSFKEVTTKSEHNDWLELNSRQCQCWWRAKCWYLHSGLVLLCLGKGSGVETTRCPTMME